MEDLTGTGHFYELDSVLGKRQQTVQFLEKISNTFPEADTIVDGTTNEEVIRVLINRISRLNRKLEQPCEENEEAVNCLLGALKWLERLTARTTGLEGIKEMRELTKHDEEMDSIANTLRRHGEMIADNRSLMIKELEILKSEVKVIIEEVKDKSSSLYAVKGKLAKTKLKLKKATELNKQQRQANYEKSLKKKR
jgi:hypothetical protein